MSTKLARTALEQVPAGHSFVPSLIPFIHSFTDPSALISKTVTTPMCLAPGQGQQKLPKTSSKGQGAQGLPTMSAGTQGEPDSMLTYSHVASQTSQGASTLSPPLSIFHTYLFTLLGQRSTWGNAFFHHMDLGIKLKSSVLVTSTSTH